jgi:hypothetical protein
MSKRTQRTYNSVFVETVSPVGAAEKCSVFIDFRLAPLRSY